MRERGGRVLIWITWGLKRIPPPQLWHMDNEDVSQGSRVQQSQGLWAWALVNTLQLLGVSLEKDFAHKSAEEATVYCGNELELFITPGTLLNLMYRKICASENVCRCVFIGIKIPISPHLDSCTVLLQCRKGCLPRGTIDSRTQGASLYESQSSSVCG